MILQNVNLTYDLKEEINKWIFTKNTIEGTSTNTTISISKIMIKYLKKHISKENDTISAFIRELIIRYLKKLNRMFKSPVILFHSRGALIRTAVLDYYLNKELDPVISYMLENGYTKIKKLKINDY